MKIYFGLCLVLVLVAQGCSKNPGSSELDKEFSRLSGLTNGNAKAFMSYDGYEVVSKKEESQVIGGQKVYGISYQARIKAKLVKDCQTSNQGVTNPADDMKYLGMCQDNNTPITIPGIILRKAGSKVSYVINVVCFSHDPSQGWECKKGG